ncbi:MAG: branched-chain amino acid aminotransferase [Syntrophaceae bacterium]
MEIRVARVSADKMKPKPTDESQLGFGKIFTDHFFLMKYSGKQGWHDAVIEGYHDLCLDPAAVCLHYGQLIFEGMKAYRGKDGSIYLFRPADNFKRMNDSAARLCMPTLDVNFTVDALKKLVMVEKDWIPRSQGASLYIRPTMIATEAFLGVKAAAEYTFFIIVGPVGAYYPQGFSPTKIFVTEEYVRAAAGGIGYCKAAGNYAASLLASKKAAEMGYTQVLWLDGVQRRYVEEVGTSNIFFVIGDELVTPPLAGTILPGVTRDSVLQIARKWKLKVSERPIAIDEVIDAAKKGTLNEAFASGTAAIVSPVGLIYYKGKEYTIQGGKIGDLTEKLYNEILQIQYGEKEDPFGWRMKISD